MLDAILERHHYPAPVARLLAEVVVLTVLLGTSLKFEGKFTVQTKGDGPVDLLVADFATPENVRAYARFDQALLDQAIAAGQTEPEQLLGKGVLAFTIDQESSASPIRASSNSTVPRSRILPASISANPSRSRRASVWRLPNFSTATAAASRGIAGGQGGSSPSSCRKRPSACASRTCMAGMAMKLRQV